MVGRWTIGRALALVVCSVAVVFAAACGGGGQGGNGGGQGGNQGPFTIGVSNGFVSSEWRTQMIDDLQRVNDEYKKEGLTEDLVIESANVDTQGQIQQMRNLINRGVDGIIVNPNDATALDQVIGQAENAGIPVIAVDQEIDAPGVTNVVIDQGEWARMGAEWLVEELGGEGDVVVINGLAGHPANEARYDAVKAVFAENPGIEVVQETNADWDQATAQQEMSNILASQPNIDGVWTQDGMARGVLQAVQADQPRRVPGDLRRGPLRLHEAVARRAPAEPGLRLLRADQPARCRRERLAGDGGALAGQGDQAERARGRSGQHPLRADTRGGDQPEPRRGAPEDRRRG